MVLVFPSRSRTSDFEDAETVERPYFSVSMALKDFEISSCCFWREALSSWSEPSLFLLFRTVMIAATTVAIAPAAVAAAVITAAVTVESIGSEDKHKKEEVKRRARPLPLFHLEPTSRLTATSLHYHFLGLLSVLLL